jgi:ArsR family transcriptional regulator
MLNKTDIQKNKAWLAKNVSHIRIQSDLCSVLSDPTRIKILLLLKHYQELCVSDIAGVLNITMGAVSHQLSMMERLHIVKKHKMGKHVCYLLDLDDIAVVEILSSHLDKHIH